MNQIEDDYAEFKKRQLKITWWVHIIMEFLAVRKALDNHLVHRAIVRRKFLRLMMYNRICIRFKSSIKKSGGLENKHRNFARDKMMLHHFLIKDRAVAESKQRFLLFLEGAAEKFSLLNLFKKTCSQVDLIKASLKAVPKARLSRQLALSKMFEHERQMLLSHFHKKKGRLAKYKKLYN